MAFIQVTHAGTEKPIHINVAHIVAVQRPGDNTHITVTGQAQAGPFNFFVSETVADVLGRISTAETYGPTR